VLAIVGVTYPTLWTWMRAGTFPRSRICGGRSMWLSTEINDWLTGLPVRPLKGDDEEN
jgi:predicted DNA-binding transcriptional regulator AlpA